MASREEYFRRIRKALSLDSGYLDGEEAGTVVEALVFAAVQVQMSSESVPFEQEAVESVAGAALGVIRSGGY